MTPPFALLGLSLVFWGWRSGFLGLALGMAAALELRRVATWRFALTDKDASRAFDLCLLLFAGAGVYLFLTPMEERPHILFTLWSPLLFFPLALAQAYAASDMVVLKTLLPALGRKRPKRGVLLDPPPLAVNLGWLYFGLCLAAAGCANLRDGWYFPGVLALCGLALWPSRSPRFGTGLWLIFLLAAGVLGYAGQYAIDRVQTAVRGWAADYRADPYRSRTALGEMGDVALKRSIALRIKADPSQGAQPFYLRTASYELFSRRDWLAVNADFRPLGQQAGQPGTWDLGAANPTAGAEKILTVFQFFPRPAGMLALPMGARRIERLPSGSLSANRLGSVKADRAPGLAGYAVRYDPEASFDAPPGGVDLLVPIEERPLMERTAARLGLGVGAGLRAEEAVARVRAFFGDGFGYTLRGKRETREADEALADFLEKDRSGHCEYYATATALLLRQAGVPTRYAVGWSVQEYDPAENLFLVRENHAHAWVLAFAGGRWREVDTTPSVWFAEEESGGDSLSQAFDDFRARAVFWFAGLRWLDEESGTRRALMWMAAPLAVFLLWRLARQGGVKGAARAARPEAPANLAATPGADSEYYLVERALAREEKPRARAETPAAWLKRLGRTEFDALIDLHYRYRFDPKGLAGRARQRLKELASVWLGRDGK